MSEGAVPSSFLSDLNKLISSRPPPGIRVIVAEECATEAADTHESSEPMEEDDQGDSIPAKIIHIVLIVLLPV